MSYQHIGDALNSPQFINRVKGAVIDISAAILGAVQDSTSVMDDAGNKLTTAACKNWCLSYLKGTSVATDAIIASFVLLNETIAADPFGYGAGTDGGINWQLKHVFLSLVSIG